MTRSSCRSRSGFSLRLQGCRKQEVSQGAAGREARMELRRETAAKGKVS